ncbi:MAG: hypothetical protein IH946_00535, partial [Bacteroidetes bacterium]|nr:hypothetical protein [Bacteroidota bacterium]
MKIRIRKWQKILIFVIIALFLTLQAGYSILRRPDVQTWMIHKITDYAAEKLHTTISVGSVAIRFFDQVQLNDVYILDQKGDTILYSKLIEADVALLKLSTNRIILDDVELYSPRFYMSRAVGEEDFNIQFIIDALTSDEPLEDPWEVGLKKLLMQDADFRIRDDKTGFYMTALLDRADIRIQVSDLQGKLIYLRSLKLDGLDVAIETTEIADTNAVKDSVSASSSLDPGGWKFIIDQLLIHSSNFRMDGRNKPASNKGIDFNHLDLSDIEITMNHVSYIQDTINALLHLSFKEKSGFVLDRLQADAKFDLNQLSLSRLDLNTPTRHIKDSIRLRYDNFSDFRDFIHEVKFELDLDGSSIDLKDIAYFAPQLTDQTQIIRVDGLIKGTVDRLRSNDLKLLAGSGTRFLGDISISGLPEIEETFIDLKIKELITSPNDVNNIVPGFTLPERLPKFGESRLSGRFTGFIYDFVAYADLKTSIGQLISDINMKIDKDSSANTSYTGKITAIDFNLGNWYNADKFVGRTTFSLNIEGNGIKLDELNTKLSGSVKYIEFNNYSYSNINLNGEFAQNLFIGDLSIADSNLDMSFKGTIDLTDSLPRFDLSADIKNAQLKELNFITEDYSLGSRITLNFQGNEIDNIQGEIDLQDIRFEI